MLRLAGAFERRPNRLGCVKGVLPIFSNYGPRGRASDWELHRLYHRVAALPGSSRRSFAYDGLALFGLNRAVIESIGAGLGTPAGASVAVDPLALMWQVLAAIALVGLVVVVILAIVEPGPLVKKRPFPRKRRSEPPTAEQDSAADRNGLDSPSAEDETSG